MKKLVMLMIVSLVVPPLFAGLSLSKIGAKIGVAGAKAHEAYNEEDVKRARRAEEAARIAKERINRIYTKQTIAAKKKGVSNCPSCAVGHDANATRIWAFEEMSQAVNDQMLCKTHYQMLCKTHYRIADGENRIYTKQTIDAKKKGISNCPLCAVGHDANATRIWAFEEMSQADQMLCKTHYTKYAIKEFLKGAMVVAIPLLVVFWLLR